MRTNHDAALDAPEDKPEKEEKFELTPDGLGKAVERPGFNESFRKVIINETGDKYLIPE